MNQILRYGAALSVLLLCFATASAQVAADSTRKDESKTLGEATVTATRLMFVTKKDTVVYNMDALSTDAGTMLGEIIDRFPGLSIKDGALYFKGRPVNRVMVNGSDFVKGDTKKALEELPAFIIKSLKAYERKTDEAMATGIDDGDRLQVVDIILRREYLGTWTGNAQAGYGPDNYWLARAFANNFADNHRVSVYGGMTNTTSYQSVNSNGDWGENGKGSGETVYKKPGFTAMWKTDKNNYKQGYFEISANAHWDYRRHDDEYGDRNENFLDKGSTFNQSRTVTRNYERLVYGGLTLNWAPTDTTYITFNPRISYRTWRENTNSLSGTWNSDPFLPDTSPIDSLVNSGDRGWPENGDPVNSQRRTNRTRSNNTHYSHYFYITHKLTSRGLRLSLRQQLSWAPTQNSSTHSMTGYRYFNAAAEGEQPTIVNRLTHSEGSNYSQMTFFDFDHPIAKNLDFRTVYGFTSMRNESNSGGNRLDSLGGIFADYDAYLNEFGKLPTGEDWHEATREAVLEEMSDRMDRKHWAEMKLTYNGKRLYANFQTTLRFAHEEIDYLRGDMEMLPLSRNFREFFINSKLRYTTDSIGRFELNYLLDTYPASMLQKVTIPDTSDPLRTSLGNPNLKDKRTHYVSFKYDRTFKGMRYIALDLGWEVEENSIAYSSIYNPVTGHTTTRPENVNGLWEAKGNLNFSLPLTKDNALTFNSNLYYNYYRNLRLSGTGGADAILNRILTQTHYSLVTANLHYRKDALEARISGNVGFRQQNSNDENTRSISNWNNYYSAYASYELPWGMKFATQLQMRHVFGSDVMEGFQRLRTIWNAEVSQTFFKKQFTLKLQAEDLLNRREQAWYNTSSDGRFSGYSKQIQRLIMLHAIWRFTTAKK